jgi:hypothetical protein
MCVTLPSLKSVPWRHGVSNMINPALRIGLLKKVFLWHLLRNPTHLFRLVNCLLPVLSIGKMILSCLLPQSGY